MKEKQIKRIWNNAKVLSNAETRADFLLDRPTIGGIKDFDERVKTALKRAYFFGYEDAIRDGCKIVKKGDSNSFKPEFNKLLEELIYQI